MGWIKNIKCEKMSLNTSLSGAIHQETGGCSPTTLALGKKAKENQRQTPSGMSELTAK